MANIVIFGTGAMAQVAKVYIDRHGPHRIVGFTVDRAFKTGDSFEGHPLVAWDELEQHFPPDAVQLLGPMTYQNLNAIRRDRFLDGRARGYKFASFIHPDSRIYTEDIGENCFILENNVIQPFASIGNDVIIWSGNHIGHHVSIGDHCFIASQVGIAGNTKIGKECHIAGQVGITHGLTIGDRCVMLNAAVVAKNLPDDTVVVGQSGDIRSFPSSRIRHLV